MVLNYVGIAVFASAGAMVAIRKGFDLCGTAALSVRSGSGWWSARYWPRY